MTGAAVRLLAKTQRQTDGCLWWTGVIDSSGYGRVGYRRVRGVPAYRAVYTELVGEIPAGLTLDHLCHTRDADCSGGHRCLHRRCVEPTHLEPVTAAENASRSVFARRTHCPAGHPYDETNTEVRNRRRFCLACRQIRNRRPRTSSAA